MRNRFINLPIGWRIVLYILGFLAVSALIIALVALFKDCSFVDALKTIFGVAEKAVEDTATEPENLTAVIKMAL